MRNSILLLASAFALVSCNGRTFLDWNRPVTDEEGFSHEQIVLGEQLPDPYSVENMTKALENVHPNSGRTALEPTDFYVRFLPRDAGQMSRLLDLGLELLDHPLDYRIVREGDWYHDPELPEDAITWQYAVVPVDFEFPKGIRYERLDDCYLAEHDPATKAGGDGIDWDEVEREAFRLTGNADMLLPQTRADGILSASMPQGRIAVMDPDFDSEPVGVKGVKVSCNSFVKFSSCFTDDEGYYRMSRSYSVNPRYRLVFQNVRGFSQGINFILLPASVSTFGKQPSEGFSITVDSYSERKLFTRCVVNNAGYDYVEASRKSSGAILAPPRDFRLWIVDMFDLELPSMMHHGVLVETMPALSAMPGEIVMLIKIIQQDAILGLQSAESYIDIYRRAMHIFAHAGHFANTDKDWWWNYLQYLLRSLAASTLQDPYGSRGDSGFEYAEVAETYAYFCENSLCRRRYPERTDYEGTSFWFYPQLLMYLDDRGLGLEQMAPLFSSDVESMEMLQQKLLSYFPQFKSVIGEAYARYER